MNNETKFEITHKEKEEKITYLKVYGCKNCPVAAWCGTSIQSTKLCNSYTQPILLD